MSAIRTTLSLIVAGLMVCSVFPCWANAQPERKQGSVLDEQEPNARRGMRGPGEQGPDDRRGMRGPGEQGPDDRRGMRGPGPWELTDELIDRVLKSIEKTDPVKAKELANLRKSDPERFGQELRERGHDEVAKIFREQMDAGRRKWQGEYLDWLEKNYPEESKELNKYKDRGPEDYMRRFELSMRKYGEIFRAYRDNPELAVVLKEDFELKEKRDALLKKIRAAKVEDEKKNLVLQLKEVTRSRYDLIVRQKEITYEQLLKRLEELKQQVNKSKDEITKWKDPKFKDENVNNHVEYLMKGLPRFRWD